MLIQFDPFFFLAEFHAQVQLKRGSTNLFKVRVEGSLAGPRPLHVKGKATFEILWWDVSIRIDKTLVEGEKPPPPAADRRAAAVEGSVGQCRATGSASFPAGQRPLVTLRAQAGGADGVLLHPLGTLTVKQTVVPLNLEISRFGQAAPAGARRFTITRVSLGGRDADDAGGEGLLCAGAVLRDDATTKSCRGPRLNRWLRASASARRSSCSPTDADDWLEVEAIEFETMDRGQREERSRGSSGVRSNLYRLSAGTAGQAGAVRGGGQQRLRRSGKAKYRTTMGKTSDCERRLEHRGDGRPDGAGRCRASKPGRPHDTIRKRAGAAQD